MRNKQFTMIPVIFIYPNPSTSVQMASPERLPRIILPSLRKENLLKNGKIHARRVENSTLKGGLHIRECLLGSLHLHGTM